MTAAPKIITVYSRPGCHLCEQALDELLPIARAHGAAIDEVDIEQNDALLRAYLERIPVVVIDDEEVCELFVEAALVQAALS